MSQSSFGNNAFKQYLDNRKLTWLPCKQIRCKPVDRTALTFFLIWSGTPDYFLLHRGRHILECDNFLHAKWWRELLTISCPNCLRLKFRLHFTIFYINIKTGSIKYFATFFLFVYRGTQCIATKYYIIEFIESTSRA